MTIVIRAWYFHRWSGHWPTPRPNTFPTFLQSFILLRLFPWKTTLRTADWISNNLPQSNATWLVPGRALPFIWKLGLQTYKIWFILPFTEEDALWQFRVLSWIFMRISLTKHDKLITFEGCGETGMSRPGGK